MNSQEKIISLITMFVDLANKNRKPMHITRLIKLLYLAEIYYYKQNQERLTDLPWKYYKKGPWCNQINNNIEESDNLHIIEQNDFKKVNFTNRNITMSKIRTLDIKSHNAVLFIFNKYSHFELNLLIAHVYNNTSPMQQAEINSQLDFSLVKPEFKTEDDYGQLSEPLTEKQQEILEKRLAERKKNQVQRKTYFGPNIYAAIEAMDKEDDIGLHD